MMYQLGLTEDMAACPESVFPRPINFGGTIVHYLIATSVGSLSFLSFGTTSHIYLYWYFLLSFAFSGKWAELHQLVTNDKAFTQLRNKRDRESRQKLDSLELSTLGSKRNSKVSKDSKDSNSNSNSVEPSNSNTSTTLDLSSGANNSTANNSTAETN